MRSVPAGRHHVRSAFCASDVPRGETPKHRVVTVCFLQLTVVPGLGVMLESRRRCGLRERTFIDSATLRSVFINEACVGPSVP